MGPNKHCGLFFITSVIHVINLQFWFITNIYQTDLYNMIMSQTKKKLQDIYPVKKNIVYSFAYIMCKYFCGREDHHINVECMNYKFSLQHFFVYKVSTRLRIGLILIAFVLARTFDAHISNLYM